MILYSESHVKFFSGSVPSRLQTASSDMMKIFRNSSVKFSVWIYKLSEQKYNWMKNYKIMNLHRHLMKYYLFLNLNFKK